LNDQQKLEIIEQAKVHWNGGNALKTGEIIFERIPLELRSFWASDLLEFVYPQITPVPEITAALDFATQPEHWSRFRYQEAHRIFDELRSLLGQLADVDDIKADILTLAEYTVAITYTARQYPAPFDHNKGWRIVDQFYRLVKRLSFDEVTAWDELTNKIYIRLEAPISCHSGCNVCHPPRWDYVK
jgi:hypothetical protein